MPSKRVTAKGTSDRLTQIIQCHLLKIIKQSTLARSLISVPDIRFSGVNSSMNKR